MQNFSRRLSLSSSILKVLGTAALLSALTGCALGNMELSGPAPEPAVTVHADIHGKSIGGQNPLAFSTLDLYAVDGNAYGGGPHLLTTVTSGTAEYYPGLSTAGCNPTGLTTTAYFIVSGTATINGTNSLIAGQLINIADSNSGLNGTYVVTAGGGTGGGATFSVATTLPDDAGTTNGTYTPVCYTHPTTDQNGLFNVSGDFACGSTYASSVVYLQNSGGNPGLTLGTNNPAIVLTALLQSSASSNVALTCSGLSSANTVTINELSTAAMGLAMGQFFTTTYGGSPSADGFGAPSSNSFGITNAANTALELVSTVNGTANTTFVQAANGYSVTATPESTKVQTIGNILASCVNGLSGNAKCTSLFGALTSTKFTGGTTPTDTLQAAALIGINPTAGSTANSNALWALAGATGAPFTGLGTQPADWAVGIQYIDTSSSCSVTSTPTTCILNFPQEVLFDASGNMFVLNHNSTTSGSLSELSSLGAPVSNQFTIAGTSIQIISPRNISVDLNGNVWIGTTSTAHILEYVPGGTSVTLAPTNQPYAITVDSNNNVFFGFASTSSTSNVQEFTSGTLAVGSQIEFHELCSTTVNAYAACTSYSAPTQTNVVAPEYGAMDTNGNLWFTNGSSTNAGVALTQMLLMSGYSSTCPHFPCLSTTSGDSITDGYSVLSSASGSLPVLNEPWGLAAGPGGIMWTPNAASAANTLAEFTSTTAGANFGSSASLNRPDYVAVDGAGNVWVSNTGGASTGNGNSISEFQGTTAGGGTVGTVLSPVNTGTAPFNTIGFARPVASGFGIISPGGVSIDNSGNVWVGVQAVGTGGLFEFVGAGAPTVNPVANQLKLGKVGARP